MKLCPTCSRELDKSMFSKSSSTKDGMNWQCKDCNKARMKKLRLGYAERVAELPAERKCSTCKEVKSSDKFNRSKVTHDGLCNTCKACEKTYQIARVKKTKEKNLVRTDYSEKRCSSCMKILPPECFSKDAARPSGLKTVCRECDSVINSEWRKKNQAKVLFKSARSRALEHGIKFTIKLEDVYVPALCPVLRFPLEPGGDERYNSPSLDRIDSRLGYEPGNVIVVSLRANRIKSDASLEELIALAEFYSNI